MKGNGQKKRKINLLTLRSLRLIECTPAGQNTPAAHGLKKLDKETTNCPPLPTTKEVGYAFIITRAVRSNTYQMDSAHHCL